MSKELQSPEAELVNYLEVIRARYSAYHNHKELLHWGAVAVTLATFGVVAETAQGLGLVGALVISSFILTVLCLVCSFIRAHQARQQEAYVIEAACDRLLAQLLAGVRVTREDCAPEKIDASPLLVARDDFRFPRCLNRSIRELERTPSGRGRVFLMAHAMILTSAAAAVALVWAGYLLPGKDDASKRRSQGATPDPIEDVK